MNNQLIQAKLNMDAADAMHNALCLKYGERSDVAMYALQQSIAAFVVFCELERLERE